MESGTVWSEMTGTVWSEMGGTVWSVIATVPDNDITGGKIVKSRVKKKKNKTGQAFREAANTLWRSQCPLGDMLRKRKAKKGAKSAIVYMARKLASIYHTFSR